MITFDDFKKIELRTARVLEAQEVEGADKLLRLMIDIGGERRQVVAGIKKVYAPADLIGRDIIVVVNLEPRTVMGIESQGMLLAANDGGPVLLRPDRSVPPGAPIS